MVGVNAVISIVSQSDILIRKLDTKVCFSVPARITAYQEVLGIIKPLWADTTLAAPHTTINDFGHGASFQSAVYRLL